MTPRRVLLLLRDGVLMLGIALSLMLGIEGSMRLYGRLRTGRWPVTVRSIVYDIRDRTAQLYRRHPFLNTAPREGVHVATAFNKQVALNSLGYRSPERPRVRPAGVERVVCSGGSTTFDVLVADEYAWPGVLEVLLGRGGRPVEVWNGGFPGWTSLENLIALEIRDVDLAPDVVVLYQGINDLQPAAHRPFSPQYEGLHAGLTAHALGVDGSSLPWYERSVVLEALRKVFPITIDAEATRREARTRARLPEEAVQVFERNVRSFVAVARAHGADVLLVTQVIRLRAGRWQQDDLVFDWWIPDLDIRRAAVEIDRFNDVMRDMSARGEVAVADAAREVGWTDDDFGDAMHTSKQGSRKLAEFLSQSVSRLLTRRERRPAG